LNKKTQPEIMQLCHDDVSTMATLAAVASKGTPLDVAGTTHFEDWNRSTGTGSLGRFSGDG
jgi:hypothetical protein